MVTVWSSLIHPWEAGGDALLRWDHAMKIDPFSHEAGRIARHDLARALVEYDMDALALAQAGWFHVEPMDFNAIRAADMEAMAAIAQILDKPHDVEAWQRRVETIRQAFQAKMIINERPYDLEGLAEVPILQDSTGQFMTLFGGLPTRGRPKHCWPASPAAFLDSVSSHDDPGRCGQLRPDHLLAWQHLALCELADLSRVAPIRLQRCRQRTC